MEPVIVTDPKTGTKLRILMSLENFNKCKTDKILLRKLVKDGRKEEGRNKSTGLHLQCPTSSTINSGEGSAAANTAKNIGSPGFHPHCRTDSNANIVKITEIVNSPSSHLQYGTDTAVNATKDTAASDTAENVDSPGFYPQHMTGRTVNATKYSVAASTTENVDNPGFHLQYKTGNYVDASQSIAAPDTAELIESPGERLRHATGETLNALEDAAAADSAENVDNIYRWRDSSVLLLLTLYQEIEAKFNDPKLSKKKVWEQIAKDMVEPVTGLQCMSKFRALQKYYKAIKDHNAKSGNDRKSWKFFDRMDEIFGQRAWANPQTIVSSDNTGSTASQELRQASHLPQSNITVESSQPGTSGIGASGFHGNRKRTAVEDKLDVVADLLKKRISQREEHEQNKERRHSQFLKILETFLNK